MKDVVFTAIWKSTRSAFFASFQTYKAHSLSVIPIFYTRVTYFRFDAGFSGFELK
jgi:hypothetical protein